MLMKLAKKEVHLYKKGFQNLYAQQLNCPPSSFNRIKIPLVQGPREGISIDINVCERKNSDLSDLLLLLSM